MFSSPIILTLCFLSFILGQLFNSFCARLSSPVVKIESISQSLVDAGASFSLNSLVLIVLMVLIIHDVFIAIVIRRLLMIPTAAPKRTLKALLKAADDTDIHQAFDRLALVLFNPARVKVPAAARHNLAGRKWMVPSIPRPFWIIYRPALITFVIDRAALIQYSTALVLFANRTVAFPPLTRGRTGHQDIPRHAQCFQLNLRLILLALAASKAHFEMDEGICYASIEEVPDSTVASSVKEEKIAMVPGLSYKALRSPCPVTYLPSARLQVPPRIVLYFHLNLLRHIPALVVTSRTHQLKICTATTEEVEPTAETLVVQAVSEEDNSQVVAEVEDTYTAQAMSSIEEKMEPAAIDESILSFSTLEVQDTTDTTLVEAVKSSGAEEKAEVVDVAQESAPTYEEFDWDQAPSYEEFANDAPPEPLFEKRFVSLEHAVHRPPPLALLAARTGAKASFHARASRLPLLNRLSSRLSNISGTPAEPVAAA
ncbi:hypothetical protein DFH09DRAFT_1454289 [Mycena vulgaris]|nr:hypothetical protein DFH09DRAFT_1454289 [Mycena vulgaris]